MTGLADTHGLMLACILLQRYETLERAVEHAKEQAERLRALPETAGTMLSVKEYWAAADILRRRPMGDMTDLHTYWHGDYWDFADSTYDENPCTARVCRRCGATALHWQMTAKGWRLFNNRREQHVCDVTSTFDNLDKEEMKQRPHKQFTVHFAGQTFRRNTKQPYRRLVLKRPRTFPDGWIAHAWLEDPAKAEQMARKLERHAWATAVINLEDCE